MDITADHDAAAPASELVRLQAGFPGFRIWREALYGRERYVARSQHRGQRPHTVITSDPAELRAALSAGHDPQADIQPFDPGRPSVARVYDRWLGGKDNYAADRAAADKLNAEYPAIALIAQANRQFVTRAVRFAASQGIGQFLDIGAGLPAAPAVHDTAREQIPAARVAYVDHDPVVLTHARAILAASDDIAVVPGDMRQPDEILSCPDLRAVINLERPVCVLLASVLHFVTSAEADSIAASFKAAVAPGSYLVVSAGTSTRTSPGLVDSLRAAYQGTTVVTGRPEEEIKDYFAGWEMVPPGLADVWAWRPDRLLSCPPPPGARIVGAVARKPAPARAVGRPA